MATLLPEGKQSFTDGAGKPLVGGKLYTYDAGTSTPRPTYADAAGTIANTNPVVLDARGEATVFWQGAYKAVLKDASGVTVWTVDHVLDGGAALALDLLDTAPGKGAALVGADDGESGTLWTTLAGFIDKVKTAGAAVIPFDWAAIPAAVNKIDWGIRTSVRGQNVLRWIPPSEWAAIFAGTSTYDATAAIQSAIDAKGEAWLPGDGAYKITATLTVGFGQKLRGANARIVQYTTNTPIIAVSSSKWEVSGLHLDYATQQGVADTVAMGVTFNGAFEGEFANCTISKAFKGFGVSLATSFAYECTFRNIRVIDAYDYGVAFDVNGSIGLTTNTFDNVYVLQTDVGTASPQSKGFLIQYHTGGLVMRNCAADKLAGGVLLFLKGCSGAIVDSFYAEANTMKSGSGLLSINACADVNIRGYLPWTNTGILGAGQTASFVRITGSSRGINISGRENGTNVTGNLGTIYGIDCNSSNTAIRVNAREFVSDSGFARLDALITGSYYQVWSYSGQVLQDEVLTRKIQYRSAAPTTGTWAQGDTVVNSSPGTSSPVDKWRCIIAGTPGTWRPFGWTVLRGATAARPTLGAQDIGVQYLDNTLDADGKPIWWNGTAWVDATGAAV